jgi:hypothetical protein
MKPRRGAMIIDKQVNMPTNPEGVIIDKQVNMPTNPEGVK